MSGDTAIASHLWFCLAVALLAVAGCRGEMRTEVDSPPKTDSNRQGTEEQQAAQTMRGHFGDIQLKAWPRIDAASIGTLLASTDVQAIVGQPQVKARRTSSESGWLWSWQSADSEDCYVFIELINEGFAESVGILQAGSLRNGVARGEFEEIDLSSFGILGFWNSGHGADSLTVCCRHRMLSINTGKLAGSSEAGAADQKKIAIALATKLFESAE